MPLKNLETEEFKNLMQETLIKTIEYFFKKNQEFAIACEIDVVSFSPELPKELQDEMSEITIFMIANYSFESASLEDDYFSFEAGFGEENIGALVHIPILAIKQIFINEYPIFMNIAPSQTQEEEKEEAIIDSMSALLNNPENAKLLKKNKK